MGKKCSLSLEKVIKQEKEKNTKTLRGYGEDFCTTITTTFFVFYILSIKSSENP